MDDSFFDVPAGYTDADIEMAELTERGNQYARLVRLAGSPSNVESLRNGLLVVVRRVSPEGPYAVFMRLTDPDTDSGIEYSFDAETWHPTAKTARLYQEGRA